MQKRTYPVTFQACVENASGRLGARLRVEGSKVRLPALDDLQGLGPQRPGGARGRRQRLLRAEAWQRVRGVGSGFRL